MHKHWSWVWFTLTCGKKGRSLWRLGCCTGADTLPFWSFIFRVIVNDLTHCGLVMPYGDIDLSLVKLPPNESLDFTDGKSILVKVMAWCHQATSRYLSQCWSRFMSPYGITSPGRFNALKWRSDCVSDLTWPPGWWLFWGVFQQKFLCQCDANDCLTEYSECRSPCSVNVCKLWSSRCW